MNWIWTSIVFAGFFALFVVFFIGGTEQYTPVQNIEESSGGITQTVRTQVGDTFQLTVPDDTEGYQWQTIFNDGYVTLEDTERTDGVTTFTFQATLQGATDVSFVYEPEDGGESLEEHATRVEIR